MDVKKCCSIEWNWGFCSLWSLYLKGFCLRLLSSRSWQDTKVPCKTWSRDSNSIEHGNFYLHFTKNTEIRKGSVTIAINNKNNNHDGHFDLKTLVVYPSILSTIRIFWEHCSKPLSKASRLNLYFHVSPHCAFPRHNFRWHVAFGPSDPCCPRITSQHVSYL